MYQYCFSSAGRGNGRGAMPFLMSLALEHESVTLAWIDNASVQFPLNIYATKGFTHVVHINPAAVEVVYREGGSEGASAVRAHIASGRLMGLQGWLESAGARS